MADPDDTTEAESPELAAAEAEATEAEPTVESAAEVESVPDDREGQATSSSGWAQLRNVLVRRPSRGQWIVAVLCALLGFGIVLQVRTVNSDEALDSARPEDLVRVLDSLDDRSDRLDGQIEELVETRDRLAGARDVAAAAAAERAARDRDIAVLAGTIAATGPGIVIDFSGPVDATLLLDTVQELRDAGAEAIQVGDVRVIASTSFQEGAEPGQVLVDGTTLTEPFAMTAIGDASTMASALRIPGGVIDSATADGVELRVRQLGEVTVEATVPLQSPDAAAPTS